MDFRAILGIAHQNDWSMSEAVTIGIACTRLKWAVLLDPHSDDTIDRLQENIYPELYANKKDDLLKIYWP